MFRAKLLEGHLLWSSIWVSELYFLGSPRSCVCPKFRVQPFYQKVHRVPSVYHPRPKLLQWHKVQFWWVDQRAFPYSWEGDCGRDSLFLPLDNVAFGCDAWYSCHNLLPAWNRANTQVEGKAKRNVQQKMLEAWGASSQWLSNWCRPIP